jgi:hypothetical protein
MKNAISFLVIFFAVSLLSCQDSREDAKSLPDYTTYKNVGMRIPTETGSRWIQTYYELNNVSGRVGVPYSISSTSLQHSLNSVSNLIGVTFQYGLDDAGIQHVIVIPVDGSLRLFNQISGRAYIDANSDTEISKDVAEAWANNFKAAHPSAIWAHYFGRNIFDEIVTLSNFSVLDIIPAVNDADLSPQLLLIVGDTEALTTGRTATETNVYDASYPCPKCPVQ